jgi:hypothetical protein
MKFNLKKIVLAGALLASGLTGVVEANAAPIARDAAVAAPAPIDHVRFGCGPGWHPNHWGRCVPNGRRVVIIRRRHRW